MSGPLVWMFAGARLDLTRLTGCKPRSPNKLTAPPESGKHVMGPAPLVAIYPWSSVCLCVVVQNPDVRLSLLAILLVGLALSNQPRNAGTLLYAIRYRYVGITIYALVKHCIRAMCDA